MIKNQYHPSREVRYYWRNRERIVEKKRAAARSKPRKPSKPRRKEGAPRERPDPLMRINDEAKQMKSAQLAKAEREKCERIRNEIEQIRWQA